MCHAGVPSHLSISLSPPVSNHIHIRIFGVLAEIGGDLRLSTGLLICWGDDLAHLSGVGNSRDPNPGNLGRLRPHLRKRSEQGCSDPDLDPSQRVDVLVDRFASRSGLGRLSYGAAQSQRCHADLVSMLENRCVNLKLGLKLGVFRLGEISSTSTPLLIYHFVASVGPSQPLLIYWP